MVPNPSQVPHGGTPILTARDKVSAQSQTIAVMLPKIVRKTLGLKDGAISHLAIEDNGVVLRGEGMTRPVVLQVSLIGTYHNDLLNNLFLYLSNNRQNGILGLTTGALTKVIFFKNGQIVFAGSTDATERIGNVLIRMGLVTAEQVAAVAEHADPRRFGVQLRDAGYITSEQLWEGLRVQVSGICCSLVNFPVSTFFFVPGCVPKDSFNHFVIEPSEVLFQGMIRLDEHNRRVGYDAQKQARSALDVLSAMEQD